MLSNIKAGACLLCLVVVFGLAGRWDYEDQVAMSAITFACTPDTTGQSASRNSQSRSESPLRQAVYRRSAEATVCDEIVVYRCIQVN